MSVTRAAVGCLVAVAALVGLMLLVRPAIFSLAPPRDDSRVVVASANEASSGPLRRDVVLSRSQGFDGEIPGENGTVQVSVIVIPVGFGQFAVVNGASPVQEGCAVSAERGRLVDCAGRAWTLDGRPLDAGNPPLQAFSVGVRDGAVVADLTRVVSPGD